MANSIYNAAIGDVFEILEHQEEINRITEAQAVKEFAEKLKETVFDYLGVKTLEEADKLSLLDSTLTYDVVTDRIDELLKEYEK